MTITIPSALWDKYNEACDFFLTDEHLSSNCTLVYPSRKIPCDNCVVTNVGGTSYNSYAHGGQSPFNFGSCPLCGGNGFHSEEITGTIRLRIYWNKKDWVKVSTISFSSAEVQVIGYTSDLPNFRKANEIILMNNINGYEYRMVLSGEPVPWGFSKGRYFVAYLKRV